MINKVRPPIDNLDSFHLGSQCPVTLILRVLLFFVLVVFSPSCNVVAVIFVVVLHCTYSMSLQYTKLISELC